MIHLDGLSPKCRLRICVGYWLPPLGCGSSLPRLRWAGLPSGHPSENRLARTSNLMRRQTQVIGDEAAK